VPILQQSPLFCPRSRDLPYSLIFSPNSTLFDNILTRKHRIPCSPLHIRPTGIPPLPPSVVCTSAMGRSYIIHVQRHINCSENFPGSFNSSGGYLLYTLSRLLGNRAHQIFSGGGCCFAGNNRHSEFFWDGL
jgi:hypothetical protein